MWQHLFFILITLGASLSSLSGQEPSCQHLCPTRITHDQDPKNTGPSLHLPPLPLSWKPGLPQGMKLEHFSQTPPCYAILNLFGQPCPIVLTRQRPIPADRPPGLARPDTLSFDSKGDGPLSKTKTHTLKWHKHEDKEADCPHCGHAGLHGDNRVASGRIKLGNHSFFLQVHCRNNNQEGFLVATTWYTGMVIINNLPYRLIYMDRNLNGLVDREDFWLLAGPGDPRLKDRLLDKTRLREGSSAFPLAGGQSAKLEKIDAQGRAHLLFGPLDQKKERAYLRHRAAGVTAHWANSFATDNPERRKLLGLPKKNQAPRIKAAWQYSTTPLSLAAKATSNRPLLLWIDEEDSTQCRRLEHYTLGDPKIVEILNTRVLPVHVPLGLCFRDPRQTLGTVAVPSLIIIDRQGRVIAKHTGFIKPQALTKWFLQVLPKKGNG